MQKIGLVLAFLAVVAQPAHGDEDYLRSKLLTCYKMGDSLERLDCFDAIAFDEEISRIIDGAPNTAGPDVLRIELDVLYVDKDALIGRKVQVSGSLMLAGNTLMLSDGQLFANPIAVDFDDIPREQKLEIVRECAISCRATIQGEIGQVFYNAGVIASSIDLR